MATDATHTDPVTLEAPHDDAPLPPLVAAEEPNKAKKKGAPAAALDQVMKDVTLDTANIPGAMARMERRLGILEKAFADIVERHETSLREREAVLSAVGEDVLALRNHVDQSEKHQAGATAELRAALAQACMRLNGLEAGRPAVPGFTFPEPQAETEIPVAAAPAPAPEIRVEEVAPNAEPDSYLAAARRAANAAIAEKDKSAGLVAAPRRKGRSRLVLLGCAAPLAIVAAAVFVLNRHPVTAKPATPAAPPQQIAVVVPPPPPASPRTEAEPASPAQTEAAPIGELRERAKAGDAKAERDIGLKYLAGDGVALNEEEAARWLLRAAYSGEPMAEYWLGTLYARGRGVPEDASQANHWYEAAAKQGNRNAMHSFAVANFDGLGMEKNQVEAVRWFTKAAELGFLDSEFNLAVLYERGAGVPQNLAEAYKWYAIAAAQGDKEAASHVTALAKALKPAELTSASRAAAEFKPQPADESANAGNTASQPSGG
jgi:localization factor PodJL